MTPIKSPKKLIEVALPLAKVNVAAAREKFIHFGHTSTLHLWCARRRLAAARAVTFVQVVNDPGCQQGEGCKYDVSLERIAFERGLKFKTAEFEAGEQSLAMTRHPVRKLHPFRLIDLGHSCSAS